MKTQNIPKRRGLGKLTPRTRAGRTVVAFCVTLLVAVSVLVPTRTVLGGDDGRQKGDRMGSTTKHKHTNALIHSTSPYLLQHAHNPVDWNEWSPEVLERARREDKPIFLSIGYSACHWCHVMEHESFEDERVAAVLNSGFISIKVDREERPDIDEIYMQATVKMTGHGGWPMSVFMTPDGDPFYCGTYFPKTQFMELLTQVSDFWKNDRQALLDQGSKIRDYLQEWASHSSDGNDVISESIIVGGAEHIARYFDRSLGGLSSGRNKFPPSMTLDLMLRAHRRNANVDLLDAVNVTLTHMARGGIYDHLGGGICRYSTDPQWLVPHFEKMLYDQGLVSGIYVDAWLVTKNPLFRETAEGICNYVISDLQSPGGGFYSTRDADSEGMEGKYYIWTVQQVEEVLGPDDAALFCAYYDVTEKGNWFESRGHAPPGPKNILNIKTDRESFEKQHGLEPNSWKAKLRTMNTKMLAARQQRVSPHLDDKILTAWNGLMIASLAKASAAFDEPRFAQAAARAADFVLNEMVKDGKLLRTHRNGQSRLVGYLADYSFFIEGLLNLYEATFDVKWLQAATTLTDDQIARYYDSKGGAFFYTAIDGEKLLTRTKDPNDGAIPSGNSVAAMNLLRLVIFTGKRDYREKAESIFKTFAVKAERSPFQFERLLCAVDFYYGQPKEVAIVGNISDPKVRAMLAAVRGSYRPNKIVAFMTDGDTTSDIQDVVPLLKGKKTINGQPAAYVCQNYRCKKPVTDVPSLIALLDAPTDTRETTQATEPAK
jgi:uncharacterized protein